MLGFVWMVLIFRDLLFQEGFLCYWFQVFIIPQKFENYLVYFGQEIFSYAKYITNVPKSEQQYCIYYYSFPFQRKVSLVLYFNVVFHFLNTFCDIISFRLFNIIIEVNAQDFHKFFYIPFYWKFVVVMIYSVCLD